jgi:hypothetical protein
VTCGDRYADAAGTGIALGRWPILARAPVRTTPRNLVRVAGGRTHLSRPIGPLGVISAPRNSHGLPESRSRESRPTTRRPLEPHCRTAGALTHRPAVRRPDPSVLLAGTPTRISRSNRVGPSGQLLTVGLHGVAVKAAFPLARRVCPAQDGWNYLYGIPGDEARLAPTMPLSEVEPMVDRADPTGVPWSWPDPPHRPRRGGGPPWPPSPDPPARWLRCCWWSSSVACGRGRPRSA